ncbi:SIS domain-containing protein [Actinopolyspora erythraea]|uniref:SIS domain-containing protein n=1 Tax=Actinopolyspora erythraea TaxID=414996 RepID=A0A223RPR4_9ACTN|nr:SIS domain-containing protein [Actinopolyspora erythraea]ASU77869.1 SIS domain-containing protein [Actinopolyspora erythraea]
MTERGLARLPELLRRSGEEVLTKISEIDARPVAGIVEILAGAKRVFVLGAGRSRLVAEAFGMRLSQLGVTCHVVGSSTAPAIEAGDVLVCCSRSGNTGTVVLLTEKAVDVGATVVAVTGDGTSRLGELADHLIPVEQDAARSTDEGALFAGSAFEETAFLLFDCVTNALAGELDVDSESAARRHANLE